MPFASPMKYKKRFKKSDGDHLSEIPPFHLETTFLEDHENK